MGSPVWFMGFVGGEFRDKPARAVSALKIARHYDAESIMYKVEQVEQY